MNPFCLLRPASLVLFALFAVALTACGGGGGGGGEILPGGGTPPPTREFVHEATPANIDGNLTYLSHPFLDGDPSAVLFVTRHLNPGGVTDGWNEHVTSVWYDDTVGQWAIVNQDFAAMPVGISFNVDIATGRPDVFVHTVASANRSGSTTWLDRPGVTSNANARLLVQHTMNTPGRAGAFLNNHPIGVYFDSGIGVWRIANEDGGTMVLSVSFNVAVVTSDPASFVHVATGPSRTANYTLIDHPVINGNVDALLVVTSNENPDGRGTYVANDRPAGVFYDLGSSRWGIFNEDRTNIPLDAAWNVRILR